MLAHGSHEIRGHMRAELVRLLRAWGCILVLGACEVGIALLPVPHALRPLLLVPAAGMIVIVALSFMEVRKGPAIVRAFAVGALFWLLVLLGLGSADPLTRIPQINAPDAPHRARDAR